jgi:hypothetical protein
MSDVESAVKEMKNILDALKKLKESADNMSEKSGSDEDGGECSMAICDSMLGNILRQTEVIKYELADQLKPKAYFHVLTNVAAMQDFVFRMFLFALGADDKTFIQDMKELREAFSNMAGEIEDCRAKFKKANKEND